MLSVDNHLQQRSRQQSRTNPASQRRDVALAWRPDLRDRPRWPYAQAASQPAPPWSAYASQRLCASFFIIDNFITLSFVRHAGLPPAKKQNKPHSPVTLARIQVIDVSEVYSTCMFICFKVNLKLNMLFH